MVIKWIPSFEDFFSRTFGSKGPLIYVLREDADMPSVADDLLDIGAHYGTSGSLMEDLIKRLPYTGSIFKDENKTVLMMISKVVAGTRIESTIKSFSCEKYGRGEFQAIVANHAGDTKYRAIAKARMNLLQNINWNSRSYPLEQHVTSVPDQPQRVEYLLEIIACQYTALQAAIRNVNADSHGLRTNFENASSHLIEVDPYRRFSRNHTPGGGGKSAHVLSVTFTGRGNSGVQLRWHTRKEFLALSSDRKDGLIQWKTHLRIRQHLINNVMLSLSKRERGESIAVVTRRVMGVETGNGNLKRL